MKKRKKRETKAERIFRETRTDCLIAIDKFGYETNPNGKSIGFNTVTIRDSEIICMRTINALTAILRNRQKHLSRDLMEGFISQERFTQETQVLNMVESTIDNSRLELEKIQKMLDDVEEQLKQIGEN